LLGDLEDGGQTVTMAPAEAAEFGARRRELRDRWIEEQLRMARGK